MGVGRRHDRWTGLLWALCALLLVSTLPAWAQRSVGDVIDDSLITTKIKGRFAADPQVSALAINIDTVNGIVSLTGVVDSEQARQRAIKLAQDTQGVKQVNTQNLHIRQ